MSNRTSAHPAAHVPGRGHPHIELDGGDAFVPDFRHRAAPLSDDEVEAMGEEFIATATSAESVAEDARDDEVADEIEGLHVETVRLDDVEDEL